MESRVDVVIDVLPRKRITAVACSMSCSLSATVRQDIFLAPARRMLRELDRELLKRLVAR